MTKAKSFTDLVVWQKAHRLTVMVYKLTKNFPDEERFTLVSQMRRSALSVTSNIAEGFGRKSSKEKNQFFFVASGSITELQNQLLLARDVELISVHNFKTTSNLSVEIAKMLNGIRKTNQIRSSTSF